MEFNHQKNSNTNITGVPLPKEQKGYEATVISEGENCIGGYESGTASGRFMIICVFISIISFNEDKMKCT